MTRVNHLAHFKLAMGRPHLIAGALLGDFVKGRLVGRLDAALEQGIRLHREIDAYTDAHPVAKRSYGRLPGRFRRYCPILIDIFYDHILASHWDDYHIEPLPEFSRTTFASLLSLEHRLPSRAVEAAHRMEESGILDRYRDTGTIAGALRSVSRRLRHANPVAEAYEPFLHSLDGLEEDFRAFFPDLEAFALRRIRNAEYRPDLPQAHKGVR